MFRWTKHRLFSSTSLNIYFSMAALTFTSCAFFYSTYSLFATGELSPSHAGDENQAMEKKVVLGLVFVICILLVGVFQKVYQRWKRHQQDAELVDIV